MAYLKRGPWSTGDTIDGDDLTAMDDAIAVAQHTAHLDLGSVSGSVLIDAATYGSVSLRLTGDATLSISGLSPSNAVGRLDVFVNADGHTVTWPTGTQWPGSAPSLTGAPDHVRLTGQGSTILARRIASYRYTEAALPAVGSALMGGYYAGIMDTIATAPNAADASQRHIRFALILSPRSMQTITAGIDFSRPYTVWDGEFVDDAYGVSDLDYPRDGASRWYVPSIYELALLMWQFKPDTTSNVASQTPTYSGVQWSVGANEFASPTESAFTTSAPARTSIAAFQSSGAQYVGGSSATQGVVSATSPSWSGYQPGQRTLVFNGGLSLAPGSVSLATDEVSTTVAVRPVRRLILAESE